MDEHNIMAVDTVYGNQDNISPRLNKQYTTVVNQGTVTVWYDRLKERLSEHAEHIKTLGQFIRPPPPPPKKKNPFKLNLSVNHFQWKTAASLCTQCQGFFFFCLQSRNPNKICLVVRARRTCFLFVCVWTGSIHDFLLGTLLEPATVIKSNRI